MGNAGLFPWLRGSPHRHRSRPVPATPDTSSSVCRTPHRGGPITSRTASRTAIDAHEHTNITGPAAEEAARRLEDFSARARFQGKVVLDDNRLRRIMARHDPAVYPGEYITCVHDHTKALCEKARRSRGEGLPDHGGCKPLACRNVALTPENTTAWKREIDRIDHRLTSRPPLPPPPAASSGSPPRRDHRLPGSFDHHPGVRVTRTIDLPAEAGARRALTQYFAECGINGNRPSVLGLAAQLGLTNTTFRRHFPELVKELSSIRSQPPTDTGTDRQTSPYDILVSRNAKLRRANHTLTDNLRLAVTQIKRLGVENARLRQALEASNNVIHIDRRDRTRQR